MYMISENMQCTEEIQEDYNDQNEVDVDTIMQTLGDAMAKNPEDEEEELPSPGRNSDIDDEISESDNRLN